jgi:hypothetical protein
MSAMEHAVPEAFWVDKSQCRYVDETGQVKNPALPDCAQAISAVKAIAIAQSQGQKIYTITPQNASTALARLPISGSVGQEIRNAVNAGKEVTIHEKPISAYGWSGYGYSIIDPETGEGGYIIEGSGNGGLLLILTGALVLLALQQLIYFAPYLLSPAGVVLLFSLGTLLIVSGLAILHKNYELCMYAMNGIIAGIGFAIALPETPLGAVLAVFLVPVLEGFVQEKICESAK